VNISLFFDLHSWLAGAALVFARLSPIFFMLPFLNGGVLTGAPRNAVIVLVGFALWPSAAGLLPSLDVYGFLLLILREVAIGVVLGAMLCWPFWVMHAMGNLIDNQRGAMLSSTVDPSSGSDTSELANFLQLLGAVIYLQGGGMTLVLETVQHSYRLCAPDQACEFSLQPILAWLDPLLAKTLIISAPVVGTLLLTEAMLGLLARYTPQMNAFSMSMTIKGPIALVVLLMYMGSHLPEEIMRMGTFSRHLEPWVIPPEAQ
jgi:type III secretion protein SpaR/YscT/HrcT